MLNRDTHQLNMLQDEKSRKAETRLHKPLMHEPVPQTSAANLCNFTAYMLLA